MKDFSDIMASKNFFSQLNTFHLLSLRTQSQDFAPKRESTSAFVGLIFVGNINNLRLKNVKNDKDKNILSFYTLKNYKFDSNVWRNFGFLDDFAFTIKIKKNNLHISCLLRSRSGLFNITLTCFFSDIPFVLVFDIFEPILYPPSSINLPSSKHSSAFSLFYA